MARITLRIDLDDQRHIGHGKIRLLELIGDLGSISQAAKAMGMSYRRAWMLVEAVNTAFDEPVTEARHGGTGGGFARLTPFGRDLVTAYRTLERQANDAAAKTLDTLGAKVVNRTASPS